MSDMMPESEILPGVKRVNFKQTWDDDCEQVIILHPHPPGTAPETPPHIHHNREVICKKSARSITIEPMMHHPPGGGKAQPFEQPMTFVRTSEVDTNGRPIFRQGVAS